MQISDAVFNMSGIKRFTVTSAGTADEATGLIKSIFCKDGYWSISSGMTVDYLIIDTEAALDLTGIQGNAGKHVDFTAKTVNTVGGTFMKNGSEVTGADRKDSRFTAPATGGSTFDFDDGRNISVTLTPS